MVRRREGREGVTRGAEDMEPKMEAVKQEKGSGETYNSMAESNEKDLGDGDDSGVDSGVGVGSSDYVGYQGLMTR